MSYCVPWYRYNRWEILIIFPYLSLYMVKEWQCTQCGKVQVRTLIGHLRAGPPETCGECGNDTFEERTLGATHTIIDSVVS